MKENKKFNILLDYDLAPLNKSTSGDLMHGYYIAKYLSKKANVYANKLNQNPILIEKETDIKPLYRRFSTSIPRSIYTYWGTLKLIFRRVKIDTVYLRYRYTRLRIPGYLYARIFRKKLVVELNGVLWEEGDGFFMSPFWRKFFLKPLLVADRIICCSEGVRKGLIKELPEVNDSTIVISNGVDGRIFRIEKMDWLRKQYHIADDEIVIAFVGAIEKWQGLQTLLHIREVIEELKIKFIIVGDGHYYGEFKSRVQLCSLWDNFIFTGNVSREKVVEIINMANFCIAPFAPGRKASPIKLFEYLACGKVVFSSNIEDVKRLKLKGVYYFKAGDSEDLSKRLRELIKYKTELLDSAETIRGDLLKRYEWSKIVDEVYGVIEDVLHIKK